MKHKLRPVYELVKTLTAENEWESTLADNLKEQEAAALLIMAFAKDIAVGNNPLDPSSYSQTVRAHKEVAND